jgi:cell division initiation protein
VAAFLSALSFFAALAMKLSPLDIRKQDFDSALRGYSKEDVEAFLQMVSEQWEDLQDEKRDLEEEVRSLRGKLEHYEEVEEALQEALQTARESSEQKIENAEKKAALMVQEAEARADEIKREAREDREVMRRQVDQLQERRDKTVAGLRAFLMSEMELLLRFDGEDPEALRESLPEELAQHVGGDRPEAEPDPEPRATPAPGGPHGAEAPEAETQDATPEAAREETSASEAPLPEVPVTEGFRETEAPPAEADDTPRAAWPESEPAEETPAEPAPSASEESEQAPPPAAANGEDAPAEEPAGEEETDELNKFLKQFEAEQGGGGTPPVGDAPESPLEERAEPEPPESEPREPEPLDAPVNEVLSSREDRDAARGDGSPDETDDPVQDDDMTATADEIDKIRRILNDME